MSLASNVTNLATRVATEAKALRTLINGNAPGLSALATSNKTNLVAAINEISAAVANASGISDTGTSSTSAWSSSKTRTEIDAAVASLIASAPGVLDTLNELAAALGNDPNYAATVTAGLAARVRVDAAQALTTAQAAQARSNIGAAAAADLGDPTTNFVTAFETGLA